MKAHSLAIILISIASATSAQIKQDSLFGKIERTIESINMDSLEHQLVQAPDSLLPSFQKMDSIRYDFNREADSLKTQYTSTVSEIDAQLNKVSGKVDSLQSINLPANKYTKTLDSLNQIRQNIETKFTDKLNTLKAKTTGKLNALDLPPEYKEPLQQLTKNVDNINLNTDVFKIPELDIPGYDLPKIDGIGDLTSKAGEIGDIGIPDDLSKIKADIKTPAGDIGKVTGQAQAYQNDIKNITQGNLDKMQKLPETLENQATKIDGMDELQKQSGIIDEHKARLDELADPKNAKKKVTEAARKAAVDHFAGKQDQLKAAMEKISKYKQKYSSVSSIKDLPRRPPNPMKGKPFIERLVPGLYLQYQRKNFYLVDVNPYVGYKLSGRFTAGLGWNHRYSYDKNKRSFNTRSRIFGPRGYVDFKLGKGFIAHVEGESMNTFVPSTIHGNPDTGQREWVWSCMTGIKKEYKIYKSLKGTALIQYNLFNRYYKAPYVDRLNARIGFEYTLKKNRKKEDSN